MPIALTFWLTRVTQNSEERIKQDIDTRSQMFSVQLQLSEELYKRRFDAYEKLYSQLVQLNSRLAAQGDGDVGSWSKLNADRVAELNQSLEMSKLHMSPAVETVTVDAWMASVRGDSVLLSQKISDLEKAMKHELDDWMLQKAGDTAPPKSKKAKTSKESFQ